MKECERKRKENLDPNPKDWSLSPFLTAPSLPSFPNFSSLPSLKLANKNASVSGIQGGGAWLQVHPHSHPTTLLSPVPKKRLAGRRLSDCLNLHLWGARSKMLKSEACRQTRVRVLVFTDAVVFFGDRCISAQFPSLARTLPEMSHQIPAGQGEALSLLGAVTLHLVACFCW